MVHLYECNTKFISKWMLIYIWSKFPTKLISTVQQMWNTKFVYKEEQLFIKLVITI
jgi:hypothetical protein